MFDRDRITPLTLAALAAVYVIWGSTYLLIRFAVETIPPFMMSGIRVLDAGAALFAWARLRGAARPSRTEWLGATISGNLMLAGGTGAVAWAEQTLPSGLTALIAAAIPLWTVLINWLVFDGRRPGMRATLGLTLGFAGIILLIGPGPLTGAGSARLDFTAVGVLLFGTLLWAFGTLHGSRASLPDSNLMTAGMQLIGGSLGLLLLSLLTSEPAQLDVAAISTRSLLSMIYLTLIGSIVAFTAYSWLLRNTTPDRATSYSYVNPVIAVFFGWAFGGEIPTARILVATAIIIVAVVLIVTRPPRPAADPPSSELAVGEKAQA